MAKLLTLLGFACLLGAASLGECLLEPKVLEQFLTNPLETVFQVWLPILVGQRPGNENGTYAQFEEYALKDESNEDIGSFTAQQLIERAGFQHKTHFVLSADGYITQLIRLINPLADQNQLKQPPFLITHGGANSPTIYLAPSNIQHHPERWPRLPEDGPISSWNMSIAFTLANNGYDVWFVSTRGDNRQDQGHTKYRVYEAQGAVHAHKNKPINTSLAELADTLKYWDFTFNEIIEFELPAHVDKVLELTGADKVSILCYSYSTMTTLPFLASRPEYAKLVHQLVVVAPIINNKGANNFFLALEKQILTLDHNFGVTLANLLLFSQPLRDFAILLNSNKALRYSLIKGLVNLGTGQSAKYRTNLDQGAINHGFKQTGFGEIKHFAQQVTAGRLQKFDYGPAKNLLKYGSIFPPVYDISKMHVDNWLLIQATNDNFGTQASVQQIVDTIPQKPYARIVLKDANHVDCFLGFERDVEVNLPILAFLDEFQLPAKPLPIRSGAEQARLDRINRQLAKFVPGLYAGDSNGIKAADAT